MTGQCYSSDEEIDSILSLGLALRERHMVCRKPLLDLEGIVVDEERDAIDIYLSALEYATRYILMHCCYPICECCGAEKLVCLIQLRCSMQIPRSRYRRRETTEQRRLWHGKGRVNLHPALVEGAPGHVLAQDLVLDCAHEHDFWTYLAFRFYIFHGALAPCLVVGARKCVYDLVDWHAI